MTAVEWLQKKYWKKLSTTEDLIIFEQAKEMEKQQIVDAFNQGFKDNSDFENPKYRDAEQYYNETFNK